MVYGLTGGIACGKSTVARRLAELGAHVVDADQIARDVVEPGSDALAEIVRTFGDEMLAPDGTLDRAALGDRVFRDTDARRELNAILHPRIAQESARRISTAIDDGARCVFYEAALLVETGQASAFDALVVVACDPETQRERLRSRDGIEQDEAQRRLDAQLPIDEKVAVADHVIHNDGTVAELHDQVDRLFHNLCGADAP